MNGAILESETAVIMEIAGKEEKRKYRRKEIINMLDGKKRAIGFVGIILGFIVILIMIYSISYPLVSYIKVHFFNESGDFVFPWKSEFTPYKEKLSEDDQKVVDSMNALVKGINTLVEGKNLDKYGASASLEQVSNDVAIYRYSLKYWYTSEDETGRFLGIKWAGQYPPAFVEKSSGGSPYDEEAPAQGLFDIETDNSWRRGTDEQNKIYEIETIHNVELTVDYINIETDETWQVTYRTLKENENPYGTTGAIGAEGAPCINSPTWISAPGINISYCEKWAADGKGYIRSLVRPCSECKNNPKAHIEHEEHGFTWFFKTVWESVKDVTKGLWDYAVEFFGGHPNRPIETGCEDGYIENGICIKCIGSKKHCAIEGFELPQKDVCEKSQDWIIGAGDPQYVVYAEGFPQGEEEGWQIDTLDVMSEVILQGAVLNAAGAFLGPIIKPLKNIAKGVLHPVQTAVSGAKSAAALGKKETYKGVAKSVKEGIENSRQFIVSSRSLIGSLATKEGWKKIGAQISESKFASILKRPLREYSKESAEKMVQELIKEGATPEDAIMLVSKEFGERSLAGVTKKYGIEVSAEQSDAISKLFLEYSDNFGKLSGKGKKEITGKINLILSKNMPDSVKAKFAKELADAQIVTLKNNIKKGIDELEPSEIIEYLGGKDPARDVIHSLHLPITKGKSPTNFLSENPEYINPVKDYIKKRAEDRVRKDIAKKITGEFSDDAGKIFSKTISPLNQISKLQDNFAARFKELYLKEAAEKGITELNEEAIAEALQKKLPELLAKVHPKYYGVMLRRAEMRLLKSGSPGYSIGLPFTSKEITFFSGMPWKKIAMQSDIAALAKARAATAAGAAKETAEAAYNKLTGEMAGSLEKNFAKIVGSGRYESTLGRLEGIGKDTAAFPFENKRYLAALGIATLAAYADSVNEKYISVGTNSLAAASPSILGMDKKEYGLNEIGSEYFIRLDKDSRDDAFTSRFFFASPCKTDLDLRKQVCICAAEYARANQEAYQLMKFGENSWVPVKNVIDDGAMKKDKVSLSSTDTRSPFSKYVLTGLMTGGIGLTVQAGMGNKVEFSYDVVTVSEGDASNALRECKTRSWWDEQIAFWNNINTKTKCISIAAEQSKYPDYNSGCNYCYTSEQYGKSALNAAVFVGQVGIDMAATIFLPGAGTIIANLATGAAGSWAQHLIAEAYKWPQH